MLRPAAREELTVGDSEKKLTSTEYEISGWGTAQKALVQVLNASIRVRTDGGVVTNSTGFAESVGSSFLLESTAEILNFSAIRVGSSDAKIIVQYYIKM